MMIALMTSLLRAVAQIVKISARVRGQRWFTVQKVRQTSSCTSRNGKQIIMISHFNACMAHLSAR
jgi:hypothetical protein